MFTDFVNRRSKQEWQGYFREHYINLRIYVQEHGELAAVVGFGVGALLVLFYKIFVLVGCLAMLAYLYIMIKARE